MVGWLELFFATRSLS